MFSRHTNPEYRRGDEGFIPLPVIIALVVLALIGCGFLYLAIKAAMAIALLVGIAVIGLPAACMLSPALSKAVRSRLDRWLQRRKRKPGGALR